MLNDKEFRVHCSTGAATCRGNLHLGLTLSLCTRRNISIQHVDEDFWPH